MDRNETENNFPRLSSIEDRPLIEGESSSYLRQFLARQRSRFDGTASETLIQIPEDRYGPLSSSSNRNSSDSSEIDQELLSVLRYPKEPWKTVVTFIWMAFCMICTTLGLSIVHDRVPDVAPLPDVVFSLIPQFDLGLAISEYLIIISVWSCIILIVFHRHRWIVFRRMFFLVGVLYLGRAITMVVTALPVANKNYFCSPKANHTSAVLVLERMWKLISGFGLSINGRHVYCGDYIYSGHTCVLVFCALMTAEYSPKKLIPVSFLMYLIAAAGVVLVSISRGHYTVDIILAYFITTVLFWMYHAIASHQGMRERGPTNFLARTWFFPIVVFLERNVAEGPLPKQYNWPLPYPKRWQAYRYDCRG